MAKTNAKQKSLLENPASDGGNEDVAAAPALPPPVADKELHPFLPSDIDIRLNPRKEFKPGELAELAGSIRTTGIVSPPVVNITDGKPPELLAGGRRLRAWEAARPGEPIECRAYHNLTPSQKLDIILGDQGNHSDWTDIEWAHAVQTAMSVDKLSAAQVATRFHRSPDWAQKKLLLLNCCPAVQELVESGRLPVKYAEKIARAADPKIQRHVAGRALYMEWSESKRAWKQNGQCNGVEALNPTYLQPFPEFMREMDAAMLGIAGGGWPVDCEYAGLPPCNTCPHNSTVIETQEPGALLGTMPAASGSKGHCLNGECYTTKAKQREKDKDKQAKEKKQETQRKLEQAEALGLVLCECCGRSLTDNKDFTKFQGKRLCPTCLKKAKKAERDGNDYDAQCREVARLEKLFPQTPEEKAAVALFKYAQTLDTAIARHLGGLSKKECQERLPVLVYLAMGHGLWAGDAKLMPKNLLDVAKGKAAWTGAHFAALWKSNKYTNKNSDAPRVNWDGKTICVPLTDDALARIAGMEALAKLWKVSLPKKPTPPPAAEETKGEGREAKGEK